MRVEHERRKEFQLSEDERSEIAKEAAGIVWRDIYEETGKTALRILKVLGWSGGTGLLYWVVAHGKIPMI